MKQAGKGDPRGRAVAVKWPPHTLQMLFKREPGSVGNKKQLMEPQAGKNAAESLQRASRPQENFTSREQDLYSNLRMG